AARPIVRVLPHLTVAVAAEAAAFTRLGELLDPKAAVVRTGTPAAASAAKTYFLILALLSVTLVWTETLTPSIRLPRARARPDRPPGDSPPQPPFPLPRAAQSSSLASAVSRLRACQSSG